MQKFTKKQTVTIATSALNEEANISAFLRSVLAQKTVNYNLDKILVISDGSTDKTVKFAKSFRDKRIVVIDNLKRVGKSKCLNQIFSSFKSDILVLFDADVRLASRNTVSNLIRPLLENSDIDLVGGIPKPYKGKTFMENAVNCTVRIYDNLKATHKTSYACEGRIMALSKRFAKKIKIPGNMIGNDAFIYYYAKKNGFKFEHVNNAIVKYRSPNNIRDQIRQNTRFLASNYRMQKFFGHAATSESSFPKGLYFNEALKEFLKHPVELLFIMGINMICRYRAKGSERLLTARWQVADSTKKLS